MSGEPVSGRPASRGPAGSAQAGPQAVEAGGVAMAALLVALGMFFAAGIAVYLLMRRMHQPWPPQGFPALPPTLWLSTLDIVFGSITIQSAVVAARRNDRIGLRRNLVASLVLCLAFLGLQSYAWHKIWVQVAGAPERSSTYLQMFYALTGLHAVHVLGGLVPLLMVTIAAFQGLYGRKKNAAVRYTAIYWHFLAVLWCVLFVLVYLL